MKEVMSKSRSMSPEERIDDWHKRASTTSSIHGTKRKRGHPLTPSSGVGRRSKSLKMDDVDMLDISELGEEDDSSEAIMHGALYDDEYDQFGEVDEAADDTSFIRSTASNKSSLPSIYDNLKSPAVDEPEVLPDADYTDGSPHRKKLISAEEAELDLGFSAEEMRADGWDDDHITLVERLTLRGFEPVLPAYWHFNYPWVPEGLFCSDDNSFVSSVQNELTHSQLAFDNLLEMSSRIRDGILMNDGIPVRQQVLRSLPERQGKKYIEHFIRYCDKDSGLDLQTAIPILTIVARPKEVSAQRIQAIARKRLQGYAEQWKEAFRIRQSIEDSPVSRASTVLHYPIPTLYAIIASYNLVALVAYRPEDGENADLRSVLLMDNNDRHYDFWNALAVALIVCHVRNVRVRIAEETGIGAKVAGLDDEAEEDPDL